MSITHIIARLSTEGRWSLSNSRCPYGELGWTQSSTTSWEVSDSLKGSVSVVIPTRNRRHLLEEALQSVLRQTVAVHECIIVNDGSADETREFLDRVDGPGIVVVSLGKSLGRCAARNLGLQRASGDLVLFLDDDDVLERTAIEVLSAALLEHAEAIGAIGGRTLFDGQARRRRIRCTRAAAVRYVGPEVLAGWYAVPGQCLFRTHVVQRVGGWDEELRVAEDQDLLLRTDRQGPVVLDPRSGPWQPDPRIESQPTRGRSGARDPRSLRGSTRGNEPSDGRALHGCRGGARCSQRGISARRLSIGSYIGANGDRESSRAQ